jgi:hypothetical protein
MNERKEMLEKEANELNSLKYIVRKEKGLCCNKKKIYQYFNGLKETIPKKEREKCNLIIDIMIPREKSDYGNIIIKGTGKN